MAARAPERRKPDGGRDRQSMRENHRERRAPRLRRRREGQGPRACSASPSNRWRSMRHPHRQARADGRLEPLRRPDHRDRRRSDTAKGFELPPRGWVVERTFTWPGRSRRLAKDWEQSIASAEAWTVVAHIRPLARRPARRCHVSWSFESGSRIGPRKTSIRTNQAEPGTIQEEKAPGAGRLSAVHLQSSLDEMLRLSWPAASGRPECRRVRVLYPRSPRPAGARASAGRARSRADGPGSRRGRPDRSCGGSGC